MNPFIWARNEKEPLEQSQEDKKAIQPNKWGTLDLAMKQELLAEALNLKEATTKKVFLKDNEKDSQRSDTNFSPHYVGDW